MLPCLAAEPVTITAIVLDPSVITMVVVTIRCSPTFSRTRHCELLSGALGHRPWPDPSSKIVSARAARAILAQISSQTGLRRKDAGKTELNGKCTELLEILVRGQKISHAAEPR